MPENTANGVSLNTSAINVEQSTQQFNAQYKPLNSGLVELNQKETLVKYQALHSPPVTPVRVERLECLLHCYEQNKKYFLVDGFRCGFRVNLSVIGFLYNLLILKVSSPNRELLE